MFETVEVFGESAICFTVKPEHLLFIVRFFKYSMLIRCDKLVDLFAIDFPNREKRFSVHYVF